MGLRTLIIFMTALVGCFNISTQATAQQNNFHTWSIEDGLPRSNIYCITQDKNGYLWAGTDGGGICRFDGKSFKTYNKKDGLAGNVVRAIMIDSKSRLWIGTDEGISLYDGLNFRNITNEEGLRGSTTLNFCEDKDGIIWAGTDDGGINKITFSEDDSVQVATLNRENGLTSDAVFDVFIDKKNRLWAATLYGGINIISFAEDTFFVDVLFGGKDIPSDLILSIEEDINGDLWFGTYDQGAFKVENIYNKDSALVLTYRDSLNGIHANAIWDIYCDRKGDIWFGSGENGFFKYDHLKFSNYTKSHGVPSNQILSVYEDKEGNLWLGTNGDGLCKYIGDHFAHFSEKEGLLNDNVQDIARDPSGNLWLVTDGGGLARIQIDDKGTAGFTHYTEKEGLASNYITSVAVGNEINPYIWIGTTNQGVLKFDGTDFLHFTEDDGLISNRVNNMYVDSKGIVWCGTAAGISRFDGVKFINVSMEKLLISDEGIKAIIEDKKGNLWFGTAGGAAKYSRNGKITTYDHEEGLYDKDINALVEDKNGNIWLGTNGAGIYFFDTQTNDSIPIHKAEGNQLLASTTINSLLFSNHNTLIAGTDKGFEKITLSNNKITQVKSYDATDGFFGVECNDNAILKDQLGNIWFGTVKGITRFSPALEKQEMPPPQTHITGLDLFFKAVDWTEKADSIKPWFHLPQSLELPYQENHLTFYFSGISTTNPDKLLFSYQLEGRETDWSPPGKENKITYSGLEPGSYTFKVTAINANGTWSPKPAHFSFTVLPPWYRTYWFYSLCIILIAGIIYLYIKVRENKLLEEKRVLEAKVDERTREVVKQKEEIEEKNKEITDSINYASHIQGAILPLEEDRKKLLPESFVLFKPKDIVSGDFYWLAKKDDRILFTASDCTGHGVPGAFMSMIGSSLLNETVAEKGITEPAKVLDELRKGIISALKQKGEEGTQKDGMDMALCCLHASDNGALKTLEYAGANNPLYLVRKENKELKDNKGNVLEPNLEGNGLKLFEIKASKQPVGYYAIQAPFENHRLDVLKGDIIYSFSDGYADQFGGPKGKKFKYKAFKKLLLDIYDMPMEDQKVMLDKTIEDWRSHTDQEGHSYEQIDDICVFGVKI